MPQPLNVAIVGCGNIAGPYAETLRPYDHITLLGAADVDPARAAAFVAKYGGTAYESLDALLADPRVDVVINLTIHHAHPEVITRCLNAGKHVHSEKPLAMTVAEAQALVQLAETRGLRLSCAPITYMGEAQQTVWRLIRDGQLGTVRVVYAEVNWGRIETWHPNPPPFYDVGALFDVGVYPLTLVTTMFGAARRVTAFGRVLYPDRVTLDGTPFHITAPDFVVAVVEMEDGTVVRLTANFYVPYGTRQQGLEFHGDLGSVILGSFQNFDAPVSFARFGDPFAPVEPVRPAYPGTEWVRAVVEMGEAIEAGRPQRATGAQAAHVVEICCAITESLQQGRPVAVESSFPRPAPMDWA